MKQTTLAVSILLALGTSACGSDGSSNGKLTTSSSETTATNSAALSDAQKQVSDLQKQVTDLTNSQNDLAQKLQTANNTIADLEKQLQTAQANQQNPAVIAALEAERDQAKNDLTALQNKVSDYEKQIKDLQSQVNTANDTIGSNKDEIQQLKDSLAKANTQNQELQNKVTAAETAQKLAETAKNEAENAKNTALAAQQQAESDKAKAETAQKQAEDVISKLKPSLVTGAVKHANQAIGATYLGGTDSASLNKKFELAQKIESETDSTLTTNQCPQATCARYAGEGSKYLAKTGDMILNFNQKSSGIAVFREEAFTQDAYDKKDYKTTAYQITDKPINSFVWYAKNPLIVDPSLLALEATYKGKAYFTPQYGTTVKSVDFTLNAKDQKVSGSLGSTGGNIPALGTLNEGKITTNSDGVVGFNGTATFNQYAISSTRMDRTLTTPGTYEGVFAGSKAEEVVGSFQSNPTATASDQRKANDTDESLQKTLFVQGAFLGTRGETAAEKAAAEAEAKRIAEEKAAAEKLAAEKAEVMKKSVSSYFSTNANSASYKYATDETARQSLIAQIGQNANEIDCKTGSDSNPGACHKSVPQGTVLMKKSQSYSGYTAIREAYNEETGIPDNSFVYFASTPTTDRKQVVKATYTGTASYSKATGAITTWENRLTLDVDGDNITGKLQKPKTGSGKEGAVMITFDQGTISTKGGVVGFDGTATFKGGASALALPNNEDMQGTFNGVFAGAAAEEVVGGFETNDKTSVTGAFVGTRQAQ